MTFEDSIHRVTLSGSEISSILYALEGWIQANDEYEEGGNLAEGLVDTLIFWMRMDLIVLQELLFQIQEW